MAIVALGCDTITGDPDRIIAIQIDGGPTQSVEERDSLQLVAWAITAGRDTVPDAPIVWRLLDLDTDTTTVGFTVDSLTGLVVAESPGSGRVRPHLEGIIPITPLTVRVTGAPDSIAPAASLRQTVAAGDSASQALSITVHDLTTYPDSVVPLSEKPVQFLVTYPQPGTAGADGFVLVPTVQDTTQREEAHSLAVTTNSTGTAAAFVRKTGTAGLPDSAIVDAAVITAIGGAVIGSPVRFVVVFERN